VATTHESDKLEKVIFDTVRESQESVLGAGRRWAKAVGDAMPMDLPIARAVVKGAFDFTEQVLKAQREFAHSMLRAANPSTSHRRTGSASANTATRAGARPRSAKRVA